MAYRRPGVTVTQEFAAAAPALAGQALPCVAVGPAYQIIENDAIGSYDGSERSYAYASVMSGAVIDTEILSGDEEFPITKMPIAVHLEDTVIEIVAECQTGACTGASFTDVTSGKFDDVIAGDVIVVTERTGVTVVAARTDGVTSDATGERNRLTAAVAGQFADVKVGDTVVVTGDSELPTATTPGSYTVTIKISDQVLVLSAEVNNGASTADSVAYSITGDRSVENAGEYTVKAKVDANTLTLTSPMPDTPEALIEYSVRRNLIEDVSVPRVESLSSAGFFADENSITMPIGFQVVVGTSAFNVIEASVFASYRALRGDLYSEIRNFERIADIEAVFGVGQIVPANPLAYALSIMKQNTVSPVNGLGLSLDFVSDESLAYTKALDVLSLEDMYAIVPLSFSPAVHALLKNHVEQMSLPGKKLERGLIISSKLNTIGLVQAEAVTSTSLVGARTVVSTQVSGSGVIGSPAVLNDATPDVFMNVQKGDSVTILAGTGVTDGTYSVLSVTTGSLTLSGNFITGAAPTGINYYVQRKDGLGADGVTFYDRNAQFLTNGAAAGHYLDILAGTYEGRFLIASVESEKEVVLAEAILGVTSLLTAVDYKITRDLSKVEQASNVAGYSSAMGSRRVVHTWSDSVQAPVGQTIYNLPGYFASSTIAGLTTGLPTQQGFTNLLISGFVGINHSTKYFSEEQLNTIADGGTMVFVQEGPGQPLLIRHQLTTDRSSIKFQEWSVTKNVDFIAKFLRNAFKGPIGKYNIEDTTMDLLKTIAAASINFLKNSTRLPYIGGNIRDGKLTSIAENEFQIDTVDMRFEFQIPIPLNYIDITIVV